MVLTWRRSRTPWPAFFWLGWGPWSAARPPPAAALPSVVEAGAIWQVALRLHPLATRPLLPALLPPLLAQLRGPTADMLVVAPTAAFSFSHAKKPARERQSPFPKKNPNALETSMHPCRSRNRPARRGFAAWNARF